jgi:hypothetical protein
VESERRWRVTFDNPPINLVTPEMLIELPELIDRMEAASELRVVVFESANPDYFLNHYDTSRVAETPKGLGVTGFPSRSIPAPASRTCPWRQSPKSGDGFVASATSSPRRWTCGSPATGPCSANPKPRAETCPAGGLEHLPRLLGRARA